MGLQVMILNKPYCIDIFQGDTVQGYNDEGFAQVKAAGIAFLDHKASQGTDEIDRMCAARRKAWMDGVAVPVVDIDGVTYHVVPQFGFYHFNGAGPAASEAAHFIAAVKAAGFAPGDDLCLDWEDIGASGYQQPATWADDFCNVVENWCGFAMKVYGGDAPRDQLAKASSAIIDRFATRRLWFCQYGLPSVPRSRSSRMEEFRPFASGKTTAISGDLARIPSQASKAIATTRRSLA